MAETEKLTELVDKLAQVVDRLTAALEAQAKANSEFAEMRQHDIEMAKRAYAWQRASYQQDARYHGYEVVETPEGIHYRKMDDAALQAFADQQQEIRQPFRTAEDAFNERYWNEQQAKRKAEREAEKAAKAE